jgi:hypothetical protein
LRPGEIDPLPSEDCRADRGAGDDGFRIEIWDQPHASQNGPEKSLEMSQIRDWGNSRIFAAQTAMAAAGAPLFAHDFSLFLH